MSHIPSHPERYFPHERLLAYELLREVLKFVVAHRGRLRGLPGRTGPQLEAAILGAVTATGSGAAAEGAERHRVFRGALTEACETAVGLEAAHLYGAITEPEYLEQRGKLLRACACLRGLALSTVDCRRGAPPHGVCLRTFGCGGAAL
jgi:hypothetical protein